MANTLRNIVLASGIIALGSGAYILNNTTKTQAFVDAPIAFVQPHEGQYTIDITDADIAKKLDAPFMATVRNGRTNRYEVPSKPHPNQFYFVEKSLLGGKTVTFFPREDFSKVTREKKMIPIYSAR